MADRMGRRIVAARNLFLLSAVAVAISACGSTQKTSHSSGKKRSKEYFAESAYGVKASPRVSNLRTKLPRGGGRSQVGKPYMVKGNWYYPKEERNYSRKGEASWYGDAFHGRLTANGEIYDMTHLTAAHPTMPLPSYARVTNLKSGTSVIVRVNDRGPFEKGRVIDLSRKAAEMLDYQTTGMAAVRVDYVGAAPLHGHDDAYLMASYRPGGKGPSIDDGLPEGVMIAMNGATPTQSAASMDASAQAFGAMNVASFVELPEFGPIGPERPWDYQLAANGLPTMAYAPEQANRAVAAFAAMDQSSNSAGRSDRDVVEAETLQTYVAVGTYENRAEADQMVALLAPFGATSIDTDRNGTSISLRSDGRNSIDELLQQAWQAGADDAFIVRD